MATTKEYSNGEVTVVWKQDLCIHSANCVKGLPEVFDTKKRPWINAGGSATDKIVDQVSKCPSGALTTYLNKKNEAMNDPEMTKLNLEKDGPILVNGNIELKNSSGEVISTGKTIALCRCGGSSNKPFCDGTHNKNGFTE